MLYQRKKSLCYRTYAIIAGQTIEPGVPFKVVVTLFLRGMTSSSNYGGSQNDITDHYGFALPSTVHIKILRRGTIIADEKRECQFGTTEIVTIKVTNIFILMQLSLLTNYRNLRPIMFQLLNHYNLIGP